MSNESKIIEEALDRNPIGLRDALDEELKTRIKEKLAEKMDGKKKAEYDDDEDDDDDEGYEDDDEEDED